MVHDESIELSLAFKKNQAAFEAAKSDLLEAHEGKYALVHDGRVIDSFASMDDAYAEGRRRFGIDEIFVGLIVENPEPESLPAADLGLINARL